MRGFTLGILATGLLGIVASAAFGGIKYKLSGDTTVYDASGGTVSVGTVNGVKTVTIYDDDGTGTDTDIPALTISGTPDGQTWKWGLLCDPLDFNRDGVFPDIGDLADFVSVFAGGSCSTGTCGDIDYNNDGVFPDTTDIDSFLSRLSGGACL